MAFSEGIVFVVGGAGYVEYGNLEGWARRTGKTITYGGTEIVDPGGFVSILEDFGEVRILIYRTYFHRIGSWVVIATLDSTCAPKHHVHKITQ
jgi:hypothetical protein